MKSIVRVVIALGAVVAAVAAWAVGPRLVADPGRADRPLAEATGRPGADLAIDLPDGALPVRVEVRFPGLGGGRVPCPCALSPASST